MAKRPFGTCCICGQEALLSFEHVPPESAFNDRPILRAHLFRILADGSLQFGNLENPSGKKQQRGAGQHTLCEKCNSDTGHWYGAAFADWAYQGMRIVSGMKGLTLIYPYNIYPLCVIKQVLCMFLSAAGPRFGPAYPDLVRLLLNKETRHLPGHIRIYIYTMSDRSRSSGITGLLKGLGGVLQTLTFSEVTFPPFGFAMTVGSPPPDDRLCDISEFAGFDYREQRQLWMQMPVMPIYTGYPGDYRSHDDVHAQAETSH